MIIKSIFEFKKTFDTTLDHVVDFDEPVIVTTDRGNAVIISETVFESLNSSIYDKPTKDEIKKIKEGEKEKISRMKSYDPSEQW